MVNPPTGRGWTANSPGSNRPKTFDFDADVEPLEQVERDGAKLAYLNATMPVFDRRGIVMRTDQTAVRGDHPSHIGNQEISIFVQVG